MRLIDVLVMISKGELKEGTKVKVKGLDGFINEYKFVKNIEFVEDEPQKYDLQDSNGKYVFEDFYLSALEDEVELIEPECKHEWHDWSVNRLGETRHYSRCEKCGVTLERPFVDRLTTDNTSDKIEELVADEINGKTLAEALSIIGSKLNEVIRYINRRTENE